MLPKPKLFYFIVFILCFNCKQIFGFEEDDVPADLSSIVDIRQRILHAGAMNPEIIQAIQHWNVMPTYKSVASESKKQCESDLKYVIEDIIDPGPKGDRMWALQLLDSFGKPPPGFLRGQINWPGSYDECLQVSAPAINASSNGFRGRYAWIAFELESNLSLIQPASLNVGACFPNSCSEDDILQLYNSTVQLLDQIWFLKKIVSKLPKFGVKFVDDNYPLSKGSVASICICALFAALVLAGSITDLVKRRKDKQMFNPRTPQESLVHFEDADRTSINSNSADATDSGDTSNLLVIAQYQKKSFLRDFILCFSAISNAEGILNVGSSEGQLLCVHGIRFFSMAWVILGHTYYFGIFTFGNLLDLVEKVDTWPIQVILQGTFSVDTFFLLSGFLLTYLFLKNKDKFTGIKNWILFYVHRYVRLTPVYAMVVMILSTWWNNIGSGPFWTTELGDTCYKSWWWHILYVNNFIDSCVGWAWYLANDMQFYVISPLFLLAFKRNRIAGFVVVSVLLLASWIATGVIAKVYKIQVMFANTEDNALQAVTAQQQTDMFNQVYDKPYTRIGPYLIGVLVACLLDMTNKRQKFLNKYVVIIGWMLSQLLSLMLLYGLYKSHMGPTTQYTYTALARSAWGISVGWVIFACLTGHAGPINTFLSWKIWIPLSRLTYCAYLVHPMVMMWYTGTLRNTMYFSTSQIVILYLSFMVLSYGLAFITSLMFEGPILKLEKFIKNL